MKLSSDQIKKIIIGALLAIVLIAAMAVAFKNQKPDTSKHIANISDSSDVEILGAYVKSNIIQLIDVRTAEEYQESHANGAINVPVEKITAGNYSEISKSLPIYVYCRSGRRSEIAKNILLQAGYSDVTDLGALTNWQTNGGKVCSTKSISC